MAFRLEVRGPDVLAGGATPDETYGVGVWGPAVFGTLNRSELADEVASTFETFDLARLAYMAILPFVIGLADALEFRVVDLGAGPSVVK